MSKLLIRGVSAWLAASCLAACRAPDRDAAGAAPATTDPRCLVDRAVALLSQEPSSDADGAEIGRLMTQFSRLASSSPEKLEEILNLASEPDIGQSALTFLEVSLLMRPESPFPLDAGATKALVDRILSERDRGLHWLRLAILTRHVDDSQHGRLILDRERVLSLLGIWEKVGGEVTPLGNRAAYYLAQCVGPYVDAFPEVRQILRARSLDESLPPEHRADAVSCFAHTDLLEERVSLAKEILAREKAAPIRAAAVELTEFLFPGAIDTPCESEAFELLVNAGSNDPDPEVRAGAARAVIRFDDIRAIRFAGKRMEDEQDARVRGAFFSGCWHIGYQSPENARAMQELAATAFQMDDDEEVRRQAIDLFLDLIEKTLWVKAGTRYGVDSRSLKLIKAMITAFRSRPPHADTRRRVKERLEREFESRYPAIGYVREYADLKKSLRE